MIGAIAKNTPEKLRLSRQSLQATLDSTGKAIEAQKAAEAAKAAPVAQGLSQNVNSWYSKNKGVIGVKSPTDKSGDLDGQCVSLVKNFAKNEYGINVGAMGGNGGPQATWDLYGKGGGFSPTDWAKITKDDTNTKYMPGDIVLQPTSAVGGTYGHIAVVTTPEDANGNFQIMESNYNVKNAKNSPIQYGRTVSRKKTLGIFRKK